MSPSADIEFLAVELMPSVAICSTFVTFA